MTKLFDAWINFVSWDQRITLPLLLLLDERVLSPCAFKLAIAKQLLDIIIKHSVIWVSHVHNIALLVNESTCWDTLESKILEGSRCAILDIVMLEGRADGAFEILNLF